jgi:hypothetical protein
VVGCAAGAPEREPAREDYRVTGGGLCCCLQSSKLFSAHMN